MPPSICGEISDTSSRIKALTSFQAFLLSSLTGPLNSDNVKLQRPPRCKPLCTVSPPTLRAAEFEEASALTQRASSYTYSNKPRTTLITSVLPEPPGPCNRIRRQRGFSMWGSRRSSARAYASQSSTCAITTARKSCCSPFRCTGLSPFPNSSMARSTYATALDLPSSSSRAIPGSSVGSQ